MWSFGCILYELHTGDPIFNGVSEQDQVFKITEMFGIPPSHMLEKGRKTANYFRRSTKVRVFLELREGQPTSLIFSFFLSSFLFFFFFFFFFFF